MQKRTLNPLSRNTQIKLVRRRVLQHDLDMFAAISGNRPGMPVPRAPMEETVKVRTAAGAKAWSASVLAAYLSHLPMSRFAVRAVRPEMGEWVRKLSNHAVEKLQQAHSRLSAARQPHRRAAPRDSLN